MQPQAHAKEPGPRDAPAVLAAVLRNQLYHSNDALSLRRRSCLLLAVGHAVAVSPTSDTPHTDDSDLTPTFVRPSNLTAQSDPRPTRLRLGFDLVNRRADRCMVRTGTSQDLGKNRPLSFHLFAQRAAERPVVMRGGGAGGVVEDCMTIRTACSGLEGGEGLIGHEARKVTSRTLIDQRSMANNMSIRTSGKTKRGLTLIIAPKSVVIALLASSIPTAIAQSCISLEGSTQCPAFNESSISTNSNLTGLFPFLSDVTDTASFDSELEDYIANGFTQTR